MRYIGSVAKALLIGIIGGAVTFAVVTMLNLESSNGGKFNASWPSAIIVGAILTLFVYLQNRDRRQ
ncbi:Uncharacterised protein [Actinomyces bovis]|uniref:Transglycosylase associated protein n=1 Tax=Actinomyces bovis TaxID=1658 RepID=A0ABY1VKG1_9ACTO|nr:Uncharacterised protein [Actinomyces bovis]VEG54392.1 Uncharacterised protein [Actinomyces israelii]